MATEDVLRLDISDLERRGIMRYLELKTKVPISVFVLAYAKCRFSHEAAHIEF